VRVDDFDYELPPERIAQAPLGRRDESRLMRLDRASGMLEHHRFTELTDLLRPGDLLVLNDTKVMHARWYGRKESGGRIELLLLEHDEADSFRWRCLLRSSRSPAVGTQLLFADGVRGRVDGHEGELWTVRFDTQGRSVESLMESLGEVPLPPYIRREKGTSAPVDDDRRYQTVYAERPGAVAAPTAGLHFSEAMLARLREAGIETARLTLHVGIGTFAPLRVERVEDHRMHAERFDLPPAAAEAVGRARASGGRVVAVGTTVVRTLEAQADGQGGVVAGSGRCDLFIYPGFEFRVVDALVTNFHLPASTLLMLVSAFAGRDNVLNGYRQAIEAGYRFYSYGDAMLVE